MDVNSAWSLNDKPETPNAATEGVKTPCFFLPGPSQVFSGEAMARLGQPPAPRPTESPMPPSLPCTWAGCMPWSPKRRESSCTISARSWDPLLCAARPPGTGGRAPAFSFIPPDRSWQGPEALLLGESQRRRPVPHLRNPYLGGGGSVSTCSRLTCANIALTKWPFQREEVPGCLRRDLALLPPGQRVFRTQRG